MYAVAIRITCADRLIHSSNAIRAAKEARRGFDFAPPTNSPDSCCSTVSPTAPRRAPVHSAWAGARTPESTRNRTAIATASRANVTPIARRRPPQAIAGSCSLAPSHPATIPSPAVPSIVAAADASSAPPAPIASARLRSITSQNGTSSVVRSHTTRIADRNEPIAPMAAPTSPIAAITPAIDSPVGAGMASGSTSPPGPTSPGTAPSTASMRAAHASVLPASQSAAMEKPRSTAAKIENSAR